MTQKDNVQVSVIIPCFNSSPILSRALDSLVSQEFTDFDVIVVDDGSRDFSDLALVVDKYKSLLNIQLIGLSENRGAPTARNVGVKTSNSEFIAFLDSDDIWHACKLLVQLSEMRRLNATISAHDYIDNIHSYEWPAIHHSKIKSHDVSLFRFSFGNPFSTPTVMVKRTGFIAFDERFRVVDDYRCWIQNVQNGRAIYIEQNMAAGFKPAIGGGGLTANLSHMHKACLNVLRHMYHDRVISLTFYLLAWSVEHAKYPIRQLNHLMRRFN